jgi:hypothetical protein
MVARHACLVNETTWALAVAALLGATVAYIGSALQQRRQADHDAQIRQEEAARRGSRGPRLGVQDRARGCVPGGVLRLAGQVRGRVWCAHCSALPGTTAR